MGHHPASRLRLTVDGTDGWDLSLDRTTGRLSARLVLAGPQRLVCHLDGLRVRHAADNALHLVVDASDELSLNVEGEKLESLAQILDAVDELVVVLRRVLMEGTSVRGEATLGPRLTTRTRGARCSRPTRG